MFKDYAVIMVIIDPGVFSLPLSCCGKHWDQRGLVRIGKHLINTDRRVRMKKDYGIFIDWQA